MNVTDNPYIQIVLDLSTGHIPEEEARRIDGPHFGMRAQSHEHGWIVWVTGYTIEEMEDWHDDDKPAAWFWPILKLAQSNDCMLVNFDGDGFEHPDLKMYDW
jgi:hypothetical protein